MKYLSFLLVLITFCSRSAAQNHVANCSFEINGMCPGTISQASLCTGWSQYHGGTADYYHTCGGGGVNVPATMGGYQQAAHGNAFMGVIAYYGSNNNKEYLTTQISSLQIGTVYEVSLSVNIPNQAGWHCNDLGVWFCDQLPAPVTGYGCLNATPQISYASYGILTDTANWVRLSKTFVADSAYDHIIIGGFTPIPGLTVAQSGSGSGSLGSYAYYFIDSVVIKPAITFSVDTLFCAGDTISIPYTAPTYFNAGNVFSAQLSDASGSFAAPVNIGSVTSTSSGTILAILPVGAAGTGYRIRITTTMPAEISGNNGRNIHIKPNPSPAANSNSTICAGATLSLSSTVLSGSNFSWTGPSSFSSTIANPQITNANTSHSGNYIITASLNGCSGKDTATVLVKPMPAVPTALSNSPVCSGNNLTLLAASSTSGVSYNWTGPLSYTSTTQNPIINNSTTSMSGTYSVTATLNGCTSAAATTVATVNLTPATPTASSNSPVCAGGSLNLSANSTTPGVTYNWTGPNGFIAITQNPIISPVPVNGSGTYSVTAELNGCISTGAGSTNVVVNNVSSLGVYPSPNDTLCINNANASFVAVPFNAGTAPQYQWYKNNTLIGGATNISYPATGIADGDSFYCRMTVTGLCADPLVLYSNKVGMTVLPVTTGPSVSISANPGLLLSPWQLVEFTALATNAGSLPKYQWKRNSQDVIGATSNVWSANNLSNLDTISCIVTSDVWCASPANVTSNRMVVNIKTGISDIDGGRKIELYPNPNNGTFTIHIPLTPFEGGIGNIDVVNAFGQTVYRNQLQITNHKLEIALPALVANGVYLLKLSADGVVYHARFTVSR